MDRYNNFYLKGIIIAILAMISQFLQAQQCPNISGLSNNETICETETLDITSNIQHASSISWSSYGDGVFINGSTDSPTYIPGSGDIADGNVILTVTVSPTGSCPDPSNITEDVLLTIISEPDPYAGDDDEICIGDTYIITSASLDGDYSSYAWSEDGAGYLSGTGPLTQTYHSDTLDAGTVTITTLEADPENPCMDSASDGMVLDIFNEPIANAGIALFNNYNILTVDRFVGYKHYFLSKL